MNKRPLEYTNKYYKLVCKDCRKAIVNNDWFYHCNYCLLSDFCDKCSPKYYKNKDGKYNESADLV